MEVDEFCARRGQTRTVFGRDAALAHYLGQAPGQIVVFHSKFSPRGQSELLKCKSLSRVIGHSNINRNVDKVILVHWAAALNAFAANIHGMALTASAKVLGTDGRCEALTSNFWDRRLLGRSKEIVANAMKHKDRL